MNKDRLRSVLLLAPAAIGILISVTTALALVPRVRTVEVITIFASAFGSGAALTGALVEFRKSRAASRAVRR
jgi:hypothetical protein